MRVILAIVLFAALRQPIYSQSVSADSSTFDFWLGEWDGWWYGKDSVKEFAVNTVHRTLDNAVIQENFEIISGVNKGFKGKSFSLLETQSKTWKQTWVDNSGSYMPFTGGIDGASRFFEREFVRNGTTVRQKMIFHSITKQAMVWDWTSSTDGGKNWKLVWRIHYQRKR